MSSTSSRPPAISTVVQKTAWLSGFNPEPLINKDQEVCLMGGRRKQFKCNLIGKYFSIIFTTSVENIPPCFLPLLHLVPLFSRNLWFFIAFKFYYMLGSPTGLPLNRQRPILSSSQFLVL